MLVDADNIISRRQPAFPKISCCQSAVVGAGVPMEVLPHEVAAPDWLFHTRSLEKCLPLGGWAQFQVRRPRRPSVGWVLWERRQRTAINTGSGSAVTYRSCDRQLRVLDRQR